MVKISPSISSSPTESGVLERDTSLGDKLYQTPSSRYKLNSQDISSPSLNPPSQCLLPESSRRSVSPLDKKGYNQFYMPPLEPLADKEIPLPPPLPHPYNDFTAGSHVTFIPSSSPSRQKKIDSI